MRRHPVHLFSSTHGPIWWSFIISIALLLSFIVFGSGRGPAEAEPIATEPAPAPTAVIVPDRVDVTVIAVPAPEPEPVAEPAPEPVSAPEPPAAAPAPAAVPDPDGAQAIAAGMLASFGWDAGQQDCLVQLWGHESGWRVNAGRTGGPYGIPQANPGSKMASAGADWETNPATQIQWGLGYISGRYGSPCAAWDSFQNKGWY